MHESNVSTCCQLVSVAIKHLIGLLLNGTNRGFILSPPEFSLEQSSSFQTLSLFFKPKGNTLNKTRILNLPVKRWGKEKQNKNMDHHWSFYLTQHWQQRETYIICSCDDLPIRTRGLNLYINPENVGEGKTCHDRQNIFAYLELKMKVFSSVIRLEPYSSQVQAWRSYQAERYTDKHKVTSALFFDYYLYHSNIKFIHLCTSEKPASSQGI